MRKSALWLLLALLVFPVHAQQQADTPFIFGMVLVGPKDDQGWSQAHYEAGLFVETQYNAEMLIYENYNASTAAEKPMAAIVDEFIDQGAELILLTSDSFRAEAEEVARLHPQTQFVHIAGDGVLIGSAPGNLSNLMGQMEWAKIIEGCLAALVTETGHIGYLGPLINNETRRLAASAYLGAKHCNSEYRNDPLENLRFEVQWVGYWFFIPDVTENPVELTHDMYDNGVDVVISGIDTQEALEVATERAASGETVFATGYNTTDACATYDTVCLGTAFFNWGPAYLEVVEAVDNGQWERTWDWRKPRSMYTDQAIVGFERGPAVSPRVTSELNRFRWELNEYNTNSLVPPSFPLWKGPLRLQDGSLLAEDGELVNVLDVWYLSQLLTGMEGESFPPLDGGL